MASQYNLHDAKTHLSKLVDRAHAGEEIVVAKAGKPYAKLVPFDEPRKVIRKAGALKGKLDHIPDSVWFDPLPEEDLRAWGVI